MQLHGTIGENLKAAIRSAERLSGHPVHPDTISYWHDLLNEARQRLREGAVADPEVEQLIAAMEGELADRAHKSN